MASDICAYGTECSESLAVVTTLLAILLTKICSQMFAADN